MNITASQLQTRGGKPEPSASQTIRTIGPWNDNDTRGMTKMHTYYNHVHITNVYSIKHAPHSCSRHTNNMWRMRGLKCFRSFSHFKSAWGYNFKTYNEIFSISRIHDSCSKVILQCGIQLAHLMLLRAPLDVLSSFSNLQEQLFKTCS